MFNKNYIHRNGMVEVPEGIKTHVTFMQEMSLESSWVQSDIYIALFWKANISFSWRTTEILRVLKTEEAQQGYVGRDGTFPYNHP